MTKKKVVCCVVTAFVLVGSLFASTAKVRELKPENPLFMGYYMNFADGIKGQSMLTDKYEAQSGSTISYIAVSNEPDPIISGKSGTISVWLKHPKKVWWEGIFGCGEPFEKGKIDIALAPPSGWQKNRALCQPGKGRILFKLSDNDKNYTILVANVDLNKWTNITFTWNQEKAAIYIDGTCAASKKNGCWPNFNKPRVLMLGANNMKQCSFRGQMDEFMIFNKALSQEDISKLQSLVDFKQDTSLTLYYPFDGDEQYQARRIVEKQIPNRLQIEFPEDRGCYFPLGRKLPVTISFPAGKKYGKKVEATYILFDVNNNKLVDEKKEIELKDNEKTVSTYDIAPDRCGIYWLVVTVKNMQGKVLKHREFPFAVTVPVPSLSKISPDFCMGAGPMADPYTNGANETDQFLGFKWDRFLLSGVSWSVMEQEKGRIYWGYTDWLINKALASGNKILFNVNYIPVWAADVNRDKAIEQYRSTGVINDKLHDVQKHGRIAFALTHYPPRDLDDWRRYVRALVRRYKGKVSHWEIFNEPNCYPVFFQNPKIYVELLKAAYQIIHEEDPDAKVVGIDGAPSYVPWTKRVLEAGGGEWLDILSIHHYNYTNPISTAKHKRIEDVKALIKKYIGKPIPIWDTEKGYMSEKRVDGRPLCDSEFFKKYGTEISRKATCHTSEHKAACYEVQAFLLEFAAGVEKAILHSGHGTNRFLPIGESLAPQEKGVALAALTKVLLNKKVIRRIDIKAHDCAGIMIEHLDGKNTLVLFANKPTTLYFSAKDRKQFNGMDFLGNPLEFGVKNGLLRVEAAMQPIYIFNCPAEMTPVEILNITAPDTILSDKDFQVSIKVNNPFDRESHMKLSTTLPQSWHVKMPKELTLAAKGSEQITCMLSPGKMKRNHYQVIFQVENEGKVIARESKTFFCEGDIKKIVMASNPIKLDTQTDDWKNIKAEHINTLAQVAEGKPREMLPELTPHWKGADDLSFSVKSTWGFDDALYLLIEVVDNKLFPAPVGKEKLGFQWDCVEIFFDGRTQNNQQDNTGKITKGAEHFRVFPPINEKPVQLRVYHKVKEPTINTTFIGRKTDKGYLIEGRIAPKKKGSFELVPGTKFGFDIAIDDTDKPDKSNGRRKSQLVWFGDEYNYRNTLGWGRFELFLSRDAEKQ